MKFSFTRTLAKLSLMSWTLMTATLYAQAISPVAIVPPVVPMEVHTPSKNDLKLNSHNDHGFWSIEDIFTKLSDKWKLQLHFEQRWGADYRLFWYHEYEAVLQYDLTNWLKNLFDRCCCSCTDDIVQYFSIGPGFNKFSTIIKDTRGVFKWAWANKPIIEANLNLKWHDWTLKQRLRGEYIDYNASHLKDFGLCRYRLILYSPYKFTCLKLNPFIFNEFFFRNNTFHTTHPTGLVGGLYEDRFRVGLAAVIAEDVLTSEVWWQWRPLKQRPGVHPHWFNTYQFGCNVAFTF